MKTVIFAGGFGTRISEETSIRPKPMVEIGGRPILWHIMKIYSTYGIDEFVILAGYKGHFIREYFANYALNASDTTFDLRSGEAVIHASSAEPWRVTVLDTGLETNTGGRLRRARKHIGDETFCLSYGDCVSNVDVTAAIEAHRATGALATLTAIQPPGRFGVVGITDVSLVASFQEKPQDSSWANGGFFVVEPEALDYITDDSQQWEHEPLDAISKTGRLHAFKHYGYWQNLDSLRDKNVLEAQWDDNPSWKIW